MNVGLSSVSTYCGVYTGISHNKLILSCTPPHNSTMAIMSRGLWLFIQFRSPHLPPLHYGFDRSDIPAATEKGRKPTLI